MRGALAAVAVMAIASCGDGGSTPASAPRGAAPPPWQRSESRADCSEFDLRRRPHFGDLHVHTAYSADATIGGTRAGPRDAYAFATGGEVLVADVDEQPTRAVRIDRPLDFAAVTDHAEWLGEVRLCSDPQSPVYDIVECRLLRQVEDPSRRFDTTVAWLFPAGIDNPPPSLPFCAREAVDCDAAAASAWEDIQLAAEEAYDRSDACRFTTFVGYEHTASRFGRHRHRNVVFRNAEVPALPASQLETDANGFPQGLWTALENDCLTAGGGCDAVAIPHNSNLSGGEQFVDPVDRADAQRRQEREPLVEVFQHKGSSECRFDRLAGAGVGTEDELCGFEQLLTPHQLPGTPPPPIDEYPYRNLVRNALKDGLGFEERLGANPFQMGFVGGSDTHNATAGAVAEVAWPGHQGSDDASPERLLRGDIRNNPGGLAVVWAEENSRDAIFAALRRRETYATSGTRPILRFFAGELADLDCADRELVAEAYRRGVPMGGEIGSDGAPPHFAVLALRDPGGGATPATTLRQLQIVKGWVDERGETREKVFDVAGEADAGDVDPRTCGAARPGFNELCTVWRDPEFDPEQRAFYYVRLLESPTCRWSTLLCRSRGVDPFAADCAARAAAAGEAFAACCEADAGDPFRERVIQERAWSSPVWFRPEAIAAVRGGLELGAAAGDAVDLEIVIGRLPPDVDPLRDGVAVALSDDDEIYSVALEGAALSPRGEGRFAFADSTGARRGLRRLDLEIDPQRRAVLRLQASDLDLAAAQRGEHAVRVRVVVGTYRADHERFWIPDGSRLSPLDGAAS